MTCASKEYEIKTKMVHHHIQNSTNTNRNLINVIKYAYFAFGLVVPFSLDIHCCTSLMSHELVTL